MAESSDQGIEKNFAPSDAAEADDSNGEPASPRTFDSSVDELEQLLAKPDDVPKTDAFGAVGSVARTAAGLGAEPDDSDDDYPKVDDDTVFTFVNDAAHRRAEQEEEPYVAQAQNNLKSHHKVDQPAEDEFAATAGDEAESAVEGDVEDEHDDDEPHEGESPAPDDEPEAHGMDDEEARDNSLYSLSGVDPNDTSDPRLPHAGYEMNGGDATVIVNTGSNDDRRIVNPQDREIFDAITFAKEVRNKKILHFFTMAALIGSGVAIYNDDKELYGLGIGAMGVGGYAKQIGTAGGHYFSKYSSRALKWAGRGVYWTGATSTFLLSAIVGLDKYEEIGDNIPILGRRCDHPPGIIYDGRDSQDVRNAFGEAQAALHLLADPDINPGTVDGIINADGTTLPAYRIFLEKNNLQEEEFLSREVCLKLDKQPGVDGLLTDGDKTSAIERQREIDPNTVDM